MSWPEDYDTDWDERARAVNSRDCYDLALKCWREKLVRLGVLLPLTEKEHRWKSEGPVENNALESLREEPS